MKIDVTNVFERNYDAINAIEGDSRRYRYIINTGSSRSSKTYSLIDLIDWYARANNNKRITIWRSTKKDTKDTVMSDFIKRLTLTGRFSPRLFNKTESIYNYTSGSRIEFRGADEESVFGLTQDVAWLNEPYSIIEDIFDQIDQRTSDFVLIDWNPKQTHYINTRLYVHPRTIVIHSTFMDNPFCPPEQRIKILSYDPDNPENVINRTANKFKWQTFGLGLFAEVEGKVFDNYEVIDDVPDSAKPYGVGFDYGYSIDPTAMVRLYLWPEMDTRYAKAVVVDQLIYATGLKPTPLHYAMIKAGIGKNELIIGDRTAQLMMDELFDRGWGNIHPAEGDNTIDYGINKMQDMIIYITKRSTNLIYEFDNYKNAKDKIGNYINTPEKNQMDHGIDATRYLSTHYMITNEFFVL